MYKIQPFRLKHKSKRSTIHYIKCGHSFPGEEMTASATTCGLDLWVFRHILCCKEALQWREDWCNEPGDVASVALADQPAETEDHRREYAKCNHEYTPEHATNDVILETHVPATDTDADDPQHAAQHTETHPENHTDEADSCLGLRWLIDAQKRMQDFVEQDRTNQQVERQPAVAYPCGVGAVRLLKHGIVTYVVQAGCPTECETRKPDEYQATDDAHENLLAACANCCTGVCCHANSSIEER